ncbi:tRNA(m5U54)methyltransferase [Colletotrichum sp. CLE4]
MSSTTEAPQAAAAAPQGLPPKPAAATATTGESSHQGQGQEQGQRKWQNGGNKPNGNKRSLQGGQGGGRGKDKQRKSKRERNITEGSSEEVLAFDVQALIALRKESLPDAPAPAPPPAAAEGEELKDGPENGEAQTETQAPSESLPETFTEIEVEVHAISSTGDGLGFQLGSTSTQVYVVPFVAPGDVAKAKVIRHVREESYSVADFISVVKAGPLRDDARVNCKYFSQCSGCQFQMLDYDTQLTHKRSIVDKAYKNFSNLNPELVPSIRDTIGSPLQYGYRTKLTPHFDGPPGHHKRNKPKQALSKVPEIGFNVKGRRHVLDIEDCPIGTEAVRLGMKRERERIARDFGNFTKGATILLRESTKRYPKKVISNGATTTATEETTTTEQAPAKEEEQPPAETPSDAVRVETDTHIDIKTCLSATGAMSNEYIDTYLFTNPANSFFQNNNSILPKFTQYIRDHVMPPAGPNRDRIKYLIDAYSGSGLFTITLASLFTGSTGIDIAKDSIECARKNARLNNLPESQCNFLAADAPQLFKQVTYPADETVVVIDPPRKGCDNDFLSQLLAFGPRRVVYVSCNVHTQARDVGVLVRGDGGDGTKYEIESIVGFDFFPQTGHVEGVAVLNRVEKSA